MSAAGPVLRSGFYAGRVRHTRTRPIGHRFDYRHLLVALDLDELPQLFRGRWLWSSERFNLASYRRSDHCGDPSQPLRASVLRLVEERTGSAPKGRVVLLTQLRHFGYVFNPVSFYFCFDVHERVDAIVAEINNTPWGEQHCYVLRARDAERCNDGGKLLRFRFNKDFHISPFFPMTLEYQWAFSDLGDELRISMQNIEHGQVVFSTDTLLRRRAWSGANAARALITYPLMSFKTIAAIYWQALRLRLKGAPFYAHPGPTSSADLAQQANP